MGQSADKAAHSKEVVLTSEAIPRRQFFTRTN
jgi:hypothetical protein